MHSIIVLIRCKEFGTMTCTISCNKYATQYVYTYPNKAKCLKHVIQTLHVNNNIPMKVEKEQNGYNYLYYTYAIFNMVMVFMNNKMSIELVLNFHYSIYNIYYIVLL